MTHTCSSALCTFIVAQVKTTLAYAHVKQGIAYIFKIVLYMSQLFLVKLAGTFGMYNLRISVLN